MAEHLVIPTDDETMDELLHALGFFKRGASGWQDRLREALRRVAVEPVGPGTPPVDPPEWSQLPLRAALKQEAGDE